jgi:hypothetical protein
MYDILFWVIIIYIFCPTYSKSFLGLQNLKVYKISVGIAILLFGAMFFLYKESLSFTNKGSILLMMSPLIFLGLLKILNYISLRLNKRELKNINRFLLVSGEEYAAFDVIGFLVLLIVPFFVPMLIRELFYL